MSTNMLMKDGLGPAAIDRIAAVFAVIVADFDNKAFKKQSLKGIDQLELKQRVEHIITVLHQYLPQPFSRAAACLKQVPEHWDFGDPDDTLRGFAAWPIIDYVGVYGLDKPKLALDTLAKLTHLFSSEFAIRPLIIADQDICLTKIQAWTGNKSEHIRRLASEGTRPRLPWGIRLKAFCQDPSYILPILDALKLDDSLYVRRSVANSLNDIAKDNPDTVIATCLAWQQQCRHLDAEQQDKLDWLIRHASRSLIKSGHPQSFNLLGFTPDPEVEIESLIVHTQSIAMGDKLSFELKWKDTKNKTKRASSDSQRYVLDYAIHFVKADGKQKAKVFKLKNCDSQAGQSQQLTKQHSFKPISTRKYYAGEHVIAIHINGVEKARASFTLR